VLLLGSRRAARAGARSTRSLEPNSRVVTIVLLPGMDGTGQLFSELEKALDPRVEAMVVAYPADAPLSYEQLEMFVRERLPSDRPFFLLGESFSGPIAVSIAASTTAHLRGLILCCSFVTNPCPWTNALRALGSVAPVHAMPLALLSRMLLGRFSTLENRLALRRALANVSATTIRTRLGAVLGVNVARLLARVKVPVLYLRASEDRIVPPSASRLISEWLPSVRIAEVEAPHFLLQVAPVAAAEHINGFMLELVGL